MTLYNILLIIWVVGFLNYNSIYNWIINKFDSSTGLNLVTDFLWDIVYSVLLIYNLSSIFNNQTNETLFIIYFASLVAVIRSVIKTKSKPMFNNKFVNISIVLTIITAIIFLFYKS